MVPLVTESGPESISKSLFRVALRKEGTPMASALLLRQGLVSSCASWFLARTPSFSLQFSGIFIKGAERDINIVVLTVGVCKRHVTLMTLIKTAVRTGSLRDEVQARRLRADGAIRLPHGSAGCWHCQTRQTRGSRCSTTFNQSGLVFVAGLMRDKKFSCGPLDWPQSADPALPDSTNHYARWHRQFGASVDGFRW